MNTAPSLAMAAHTVSHRETALSFDCAGERLHGVLALPAGAQGCAPLGVLVVVGGPQYRVGSHRQFVTLSRRLADAGHAVLRFDVRGMGDSSGAQRGFEDMHDDIAAGIATLLHAAPGVQRVALWGLCDGAAASLLYIEASRDARVAGLALLNPWVRSEQSLARTHVKHYYRERLLQPAFWAKLLRGGVGLRALRDLGANLGRLRQRKTEPAHHSFQQRMAGAWHGFEGELLLMLSDNDWTAREFEEHLRHSAEWAGARQRPRLRWQQIADADHTLSGSGARVQVDNLTLAWLQEIQRR